MRTRTQGFKIGLALHATFLQVFQKSDCLVVHLILDTYLVAQASFYIQVLKHLWASLQARFLYSSSILILEYDFSNRITWFSIKS